MQHRLQLPVQSFTRQKEHITEQQGQRYVEAVMQICKNRLMFQIKIIAVRQHIDEIRDGNVQHKPWEDFQAVHGFYFHIIGDDAVEWQQQCDGMVDEEAPADWVRDAVHPARVQEAQIRKQSEQCQHPENFVIFGDQEDDAEYRVDTADLKRQ